MHDEPILRRQPGGDEPDIPQQGCCSRQKVSLRPLIFEDTLLSVARAQRQDCHDQLPSSIFSIGQHPDESFHTDRTEIASSPLDAKSRYEHVLAARHPYGTGIKTASRQRFAIEDLHAHL